MVDFGIVSEALKIVFGNAEVLYGFVGYILIVSIVLISIDIYRLFR